MTARRSAVLSAVFVVVAGGAVWAGPKTGGAAQAGLVLGRGR